MLGYNGAIVDQSHKKDCQENYGVFNVPSRLNISISFVAFTLSILGTGTLLYNIYTSHVSEKKSFLKRFSLSMWTVRQRAINNKLLFMKQPVNYRSCNHLGLNHFAELRGECSEQDKYLPGAILTYHADLPLLNLSWLKQHYLCENTAS